MDRKLEPARVLGVLFIAGASLTALSLALPHPPLRLGLLGTDIVAAYAAGAFLLRYSQGVGERLLHGFLFAGSAMIGLAVLSVGSTGGVYGSMYVWVALYAGLFYPRRMAAVHLAWLITVQTIVITQLDNPVGFSPVTRVVLSAISLVIVTGVTNWIASAREQNERERERLIDEVDRIAHTDALTGLPNRRAWDGRVTAELEHAQRLSSRPCVAMIDIDNLKAVNDRDGHAAGDQMLREAADAWREALRGRDYIARYGGDEFAVLLSDCDLDEAERVVERLRQAACPGHSCSAGVAVWDAEESCAELIARADDSLYRAKAAGRDQLALATA